MSDTPKQLQAKIVRLIAKRRKEGYSLEMLAHKCAVSLATMARWARKESAPSGMKIDRVHATLRDMN